MAGSPLRRGGRLARSAALAGALGALVAATAGLADVASRDAAPAATQAFATGTMSLEDSRGGAAVLRAANLAPGAATTGTVTIRNAGDLRGRLELTTTRPEWSSAHGRELLEALKLSVDDITAGADADVYDGPLADLVTTPLGELAPGGQRTYRFTATLPEQGDDVDNRLQQATVSVAYDWTLTQAGPDTTTTTPPTPTTTTPPPTTTTAPTPQADTTPPPLTAPPEAPSPTPPMPEPGTLPPAPGEASAPRPTAPRVPAPACLVRITGTTRPNLLLGTARGDRIYGRAGADRLNGRGGRDCLVGGAGDDRLSGGPGADRLEGGSGRDVLTGDAGRDRMLGGTGNDKLHARDGERDVVDCGRGRDAAVVDRIDRVRSCERVSYRRPPTRRR